MILIKKGEIVMCYINKHVLGEKKIKTKINTQWRATSCHVSIRRVSNGIRGVFERIFIFQGHNLNFFFTGRKTETRLYYRG